MSNLKKELSSEFNNCDLQIEDISTSKGLFSKSFKRMNTKRWYNQNNKEESKNIEISKILIYKSKYDDFT